MEYNAELARQLAELIAKSDEGTDLYRMLPELAEQWGVRVTPYDGVEFLLYKLARHIMDQTYTRKTHDN